MSRARDLANLGGSADAGTITGESLIINGDMAVAQRGTVTGVTSEYGGADRYQFARSGAAIVTLSQDTDVPSNQGFTSSQKIDVTTADTSLAAGDYALIRQKIEAQNLQHLLYGTSGAKKVTLQFWAKSPKTGTHIVEIYHGDSGYHNSQSYTIATADTWQKVTMTFDGYQTTAINNDNGIGLMIHWWLAAGSDFSSGTLSSNTWQNTSANRAVGQVNVMDSTSNNFYLTGVKLEVGTTATDFKHESYGDNLAKCQRYYQRFTAQNNAGAIASGVEYSTTSHYYVLHHPVRMRASASASYSSLSDLRIYTQGSSSSISSISRQGGTSATTELNTATASAFGASGNGIWLRSWTAGGWMAFESEL